MQPVSPVLPASEEVEKIVGGGDHGEYTPLPAFHTEKSTLSRWSLTEEERAYIAEGGDLYICQLNFGEPLQPILPIINTPDNVLTIMLECEANVR